VPVAFGSPNLSAHILVQNLSQKKLSFWRKNLEKVYGSKGSYRQNPQNIEVMALADGMQFHFGMAGSRCVE
jgi:hypothetical protein